MTISNIESRLTKRRNEGQDIFAYISAVLMGNRHNNPKPTTLEDFRPYLSPAEIQKCEAMIAEREKREADQKARQEAMGQAWKENQAEERRQIASLTPEQRVADLQKRISERIDELVGELQSEIDSNADKFVNKRLPWSVDRDHWDRGDNLQGDIAEIMEKYLGGDKLIHSDEIDRDMVDELISDTITGVLHR
jgi:hypothetical protein